MCHAGRLSAIGLRRFFFEHDLFRSSPAANDPPNTTLSNASVIIPLERADERLVIFL